MGDLAQHKVMEPEEEKDNLVKFEPKLITGGKEPPTTGDTWLEALPVGTCFLAKRKAMNPTDFILGLFRLSAKTERAVVLNTLEHQGNLYADPVAFCNVFRMYEDLGTLSTEEEEKEHGLHSDRAEGDSGAPTPKVE